MGTVFVQDKNGKIRQRKQTITEKYAQKIIQYYNSEEFENETHWENVGKKIKNLLKQYKRASK